MLWAVLLTPGKQKPRGSGNLQFQELAALKLREAGHSAVVGQTLTICCSHWKLPKCLSQQLWLYQLCVCVAAGHQPAPWGWAYDQPQ